MSPPMVWPDEQMPIDPAMRRVVLWRALAILAACGKAPLAHVLMCLVMDVLRPPSDEDLKKMIADARSAAMESRPPS